MGWFFLDLSPEWNLQQALLFGPGLVFAKSFNFSHTKIPSNEVRQTATNLVHHVQLGRLLTVQLWGS